MYAAHFQAARIPRTVFRCNADALQRTKGAGKAEAAAAGSNSLLIPGTMLFCCMSTLVCRYARAAAPISCRHRGTLRMRVFNLQHVRVEFMYAARSSVRTFYLQHCAATLTHTKRMSNCITCMLMVLMNNNVFGVTFAKKRSTSDFCLIIVN